MQDKDPFCYHLIYLNENQAFPHIQLPRKSLYHFQSCQEIGESRDVVRFLFS